MIPATSITAATAYTASPNFFNPAYCLNVESVAALDVGIGFQCIFSFIVEMRGLRWDQPYAE